MRNIYFQYHYFLGQLFLTSLSEKKFANIYGFEMAKHYRMLKSLSEILVDNQMLIHNFQKKMVKQVCKIFPNHSKFQSCPYLLRRQAIRRGGNLGGRGVDEGGRAVRKQEGRVYRPVLFRLPARSMSPNLFISKIER